MNEKTRIYFVIGFLEIAERLYPLEYLAVVVVQSSVPLKALKRCITHVLSNYFISLF
jgi:hypothetical protein